MKLVSVNIEKDRHLDRVVPFLVAEAAGVVCLQEVFERDLPRFESALGMKSYYAPMVLFPSGNDYLSQGVAMLSKHPVTDVRNDYYATCGRKPGEIAHHTDWSNVQRVLQSGVIDTEAGAFRVANTHFTWTPDGHANDVQRKDIRSVLSLVENFDDVLLCGDFNAPRGREIYQELARHYTDNIPQEVTTTLDPNLHKANGLQYVVDVLFTSDGYKAMNVQVVDGVSDHCAVVGEVLQTREARLAA